MTKRLSERGHATLRETVRRVRENLPFDRSIAREPSTDTIETHYVQITSTTQSDGRYPGKRYNRNELTKAFEDSGEFCWLVSPNGEALSTSTTYGVRVSQPHTDGLMVYVALGAFGGTEHRLGWAPVRVVTTSLASYTRSTSTLTASSNGALAAIDGVTMAVGDRILFVRGFGGGHIDSGIYTVTSLGSAGTPWVLDRASDSASSSDFVRGHLVAVGEGTQNEGSVWELAFTGGTPFVLNTNVLVFSMIAGWPKMSATYLVKNDSLTFTNTDNLVYTATSNGALGTYDGHTVVTNDVILLVAASANYPGIHRVTQAGDASHPVILTRHESADHISKIKQGQTVKITGGTLYPGSLWRSSNSFAAEESGSSGIVFDQVLFPTTALSTSANLTLTSEHFDGQKSILCTTGAGGITITLPAAASSFVGKTVNLFKVDNGAGALTVSPTGTDKINGANASKTVAAQFDGALITGISSTDWIMTKLTQA